MVSVRPSTLALPSNRDRHQRGAEDCHRIVRRLRRPADDRQHAKAAEKVRGDQLHVRGSPPRAVDGDERPVKAPEADDVGEDLVASANGIERPFDRRSAAAS